MRNEESVDFNNNKPINYYKKNLSKSLFEFLYVIGKGGFGKVWKIKHKKTNMTYALKEMSKVKIIDRKSVKSIKTEREFLSVLHHPFLVNMICSFQDYDNLYLVMDLLSGGDLRYHISNQKKFNESQTKFFIGCTILGLEYIHNNKIIHRDIKPENLVLDENGYVAITDFGVAGKNIGDNSSETSGTPGYMAPEVLCGQNHSFPVDFFAVGIMAFEFMKGCRPYLGKNRKEIKEAILAKQERIHRKDIAELNWSKYSANFINHMIYRKVSKRLGYGGINEIKEHPWFSDLEWNDLFNKKIKSPFSPKLGDNFDKKYCGKRDNIGTETRERYQKYMNNNKFENLFLGYTWVNFNISDKDKGNNIIENNAKENDNETKINNIVFNNKVKDNIENNIQINDLKNENNNTNTQKEKKIEYPEVNNDINNKNEEKIKLKQNIKNFDYNSFNQLSNAQILQNSNLNIISPKQLQKENNNIIFIINTPSISIIKNKEINFNYKDRYLNYNQINQRKKNKDNMIYKSLSHRDNNKNSIGRFMFNEKFNKVNNISSYLSKKNKNIKFRNINKNCNKKYIIKSASTNNFQQKANIRNFHRNQSCNIINDYGNYSSKNENIELKETCLNKNTTIKKLVNKSPVLEKIEIKYKGMIKKPKEKNIVSAKKIIGRNNGYYKRCSSVRMYNKNYSSFKNFQQNINSYKINNINNILQNYNYN